MDFAIPLAAERDILIIFSNLLILWVLTKIFKFKDSSVKKAAIVVFIYVLFAYVYSLAPLLFYYTSFFNTPALRNLFGLAEDFDFLVCYAVLLLLIKKKYKEDWKQTLLLFISMAVLVQVIGLILMYVLYPPVEPGISPINKY
jgi:hypothetical protein